MHLISSLTENDKKILEKSIVFKGIPMNDLSPFLSSCQVRVYRSGHEILSLDNEGDGLYIILEGKVEVFLPQGSLKRKNESKKGYKVRVDVLESGLCFGEYSLVDHKKVSASVGALTEVRLFHLSTEDFYRIAGAQMRVENIIYKNILNHLISRCREVTEEMDDDVFVIY